MAFLRRAVTHPVAKDMLHVGLIMGSGDMIAQTYIEKKDLKSVDWQRTAKFSGLGFFFVAPSLRKWYGTLERILPHNQPHFQRAVKKVALDQICFAPFFIAAILSAVNILNGMNFRENIQSLEETYFPILKVNYTLWPMAQLINFGILPLRYQVLFAQMVALLWNTYLSLKINEKSEGSS